MPKLSPCNEGAAIVQEFLQKHYRDLRNPRVDVLFSETVIKKGGGPKAATIQVVKVDSAAGYYATRDEEEPKDFYLIQVSKPIWDRLNTEQRRYYMDHELSHAYLDDENRLKTEAPHDIEENLVVLKRWPLSLIKGTHEMARIVAKKLRQGERLDDEPQNHFDFHDVANILTEKGGGDDDADENFH